LNSLTMPLSGRERAGAASWAARSVISNPYGNLSCEKLRY
jgi:hypothetical protein